VQGTAPGTLFTTDHFSGDWGNTFGLGYNPWEQIDVFGMDAAGSLVRSRLINKIIDQIQSNRVNSGEIIHTRSQTANLVASTANRIVGTVRSLRRGNFAGAARYLTGSGPLTGTGGRQGRRAGGGIPEQWLQLQYGWKPLLQDIYNSCETVRKAWNNKGDVLSASSSVREHLDKISYVRDRAYPHGPTFRVETTSREVSGRASVYYSIESSLGSSLSQLGITNPASLAWELLPYSFVVDWFVPVGAFLERLDYTRGLVFNRGFITLQFKQSVRQRIEDSHSAPGSIVASWSGGNGQGDAFLLTREPLGTFPDVPPPTLKNPFSLTHVANALSLLSTAFGR